MTFFVKGGIGEKWKAQTKTEFYLEYLNYLNWGFLFAHLNHDSTQQRQSFQFSPTLCGLNRSKQRLSDLMKPHADH